MTKEQQIAHWAAIVDIVLTAENSIPDEVKQMLIAAKGTGQSLERRAIERYIRAVATEIVEHGGMAFESDDNEREIEPYNEF